MSDTEAALQAAIDAAPLTGLRMILADHLDEFGDARAAGYRALDRLRMWPCHHRPVPTDPRCDHWMYQMLSLWPGNSYTFAAHKPHWSNWFRNFCPRVFGSHHKSRLAADDAAASGWVKLSESDQQILLAESYT